MFSRAVSRHIFQNARCENLWIMRMMENKINFSTNRIKTFNFSAFSAKTQFVNFLVTNDKLCRSTHGFSSISCQKDYKKYQRKKRRSISRIKSRFSLVWFFLHFCIFIPQYSLWLFDNPPNETKVYGKRMKKVSRNVRWQIRTRWAIDPFFNIRL